MKMNILFLLSIILCGYSCEKLADHTNFIRVHNNTNDTIQVYAGYNYPDTTLSLEKPRLVMIYPNTQNGGIESRTDWEDKVESDTLIVFVLSKDTVDAYNWEKIRSEYNILKRYDLSLQDLKRRNWTIEYP